MKCVNSTNPDMLYWTGLRMHCGQAIELPRFVQETSGRGKMPARCPYGFNEKCAKATLNDDSAAAVRG